MKTIIPIGLIILSLFLATTSYSQKMDSLKIIDVYQEIKDGVYHIRANKGDILSINIVPEFKNEKKGVRYDIKNIKLYRQFSADEFQYIVDKKEIESFSENIVVPSDGIYTLAIDRGGIKKFNASFTIYRTPTDEMSKEVKRKALLVFIPDTLHNYIKDSAIVDYVRVSTPKVKEEKVPTYKEDQIFLDVAYAMRVGDKYVIPVHIPYELYTYNKRAKSTKWGFILTVGDEVYAGLKSKIAQVATAAIDVGVGKAMSGAGKVDDAAGVANKTNKFQKGYDVFDKAATANSVAGISGDVGEITNNKSVSTASNATTTITGFTGLSESAGNALAKFAPKIEDKIHWKLYNQEEYTKLINKQPAQCKKGTDGFVRDSIMIKDPNEVYYLVIENERNLTKNGVIGGLEAAGKTILSQYVYVTLKVWVQREVDVIFDKGYYENTFYPIYKSFWNYKQEAQKATYVIFEDEMKPYYQRINTNNIY